MATSCGGRLLTVAAFAAPLLLSGVPALAQSTTPVEVSVHATGVTAKTAKGENTLSPGISGLFNVRLLPRVSFESRVTWFSQELAALPDQGGHAFEMLAGIRGTFVQTPRWSMHGVALPGFVRFSNTITGIDTADGAATRFVLFLGGDISVNMSTRAFVRAGLGTRLTRVPGSLYCLEGYNLCLSSPAAVATPWEFSAGAGVRLGRVTQEVHNTWSPPSRRFTVGAQIGYRIAASPFGTEELHESAGIGGFLAYRLKNWIELETGVDTFSQSTYSSPEPGRLIHAFAGAKAGIRMSRVGIFVKASGGVNAYTNGVNTLTSHQTVAFKGTTTTVYGSDVTPAFDIGGVLELYVKPRWLIRLDAWDSVAIESNVPSYTYFPPSTDNIRFAAGVGWRF